MTEKLAPCPLCGHKAQIVKSGRVEAAVRIECSYCKNKSPWYAYISKAVSTWNKKAAELPPPPKPKPDALKQCPFCGGKAEMWHTANDYYVNCVKCSTTGDNYATAVEAVEAWNRRIYE